MTDSTDAASKLSTLGNVERVVNEYARLMCVKYHIDERHFVVNLSTAMDGIMKVNGGEVVQIILLWPAAQPNINTLLNDAFRLMVNHPRIRRSMEIVPFLYARTMHENTKKWMREAFKNIDDIIPDLIPRSRVRMTVETITRLEDAETGEVVTVSHKSKPTRYDGDNIGAWLELSRVVRDKHMQPIPADDPADMEPELQQALKVVR